jgi:cyclohexanone monooxygenase
LEPTAKAEADWQDVIRKKAQVRVGFLSGCTPGYYNGQGDLERGLLLNIYGGGPSEFTRVMEGWRAQGDMAGLDVS